MTIRSLSWAMVVLCTPLSAQQVPLGSGSVVQAVTTLKPGQYVWVPQVAPEGPMLLIVNLATQRALLFRNGVPIGATTVSTGKHGHRTPTGVFTILQKQIEHHSSKYDNAPMPYMQRLTWDGVALHAGNLPGYPASHGCVRLPPAFSKLLYGATRLGMTVVISDNRVTPRIAPTPDIVSSTPPGALGTTAAFEWHPEQSPNGPLSIIVSAADQKAVVLRNGIQIGMAEVIVDGAVNGTWAYTLRAMGAAGQHWMRVTLSSDASGALVPREEWARYHAPDGFKRAIAEIGRAHV